MAEVGALLPSGFALSYRQVLVDSRRRPDVLHLEIKISC